MKLAEFSRVVDAPPKWVQNAAAVLGVSFQYTLDEAQRLALARLLALTADVSLKRAYSLAAEALLEYPDLLSPRQRGPRPPGQLVLAESADGALRIAIDMDRFVSAFIARLSVTRNLYRERKRGRPAAVRAISEVPAGREWRPDHGLLAMLEGLVAAEIRFVVVGGAAESAHGSPPGTDNLGICYDAKPDNIGPLAAVLRAWKSYPRGIQPGLPFILDEIQFRATPIMALHTMLGELNALNEVDGAGSYDAALASSVAARHGDFGFRILALPSHTTLSDRGAKKIPP